MESEDFSPNEAQALMYIVWKRADHGAPNSGTPLREFKAFFNPTAAKWALESKRISVGYYAGRSVAFGSPRLRGLIKGWLMEGIDGAGVPMAYIWRSRLRPIYGVE